MINYNSAQYDFIMFFSYFDIDNYDTTIDVFDKIIAREMRNEIINCKGFIKFFGRYIDSMRKIKFNNEKIKVNISSQLNEQTESITLLLSNKGWSIETPPKFMISAHLVKDDFNTIKITSNGKPLKSFFLFALRTDVDANLEPESFFDDLKGSYGYYFKNSNYTYDGATLLEWAFHNKPIQIKEGDINRWIEPKAVYNLYS